MASAIGFAGLIFLLPGCTLIGAGTGALVDSGIPGPYKESSVQQVRLERGERVVLVARDGRRLEGRYAGQFGPTQRDPERYFLVDSKNALMPVAVSDLRAVGVEETGRGWLYGGLVGLAVDATAIVVLMVAYPSYGGAGWSTGGGCGWGC